jgi:DHA2 family multidrug resistance protein
MFTADKPFIEPALFRDRNLAVGLVLIFIIGVILLATLSLLPPFLQRLMGYPVLTTGLALAPRGVGTMISMMAVGRLIGRVDTRLLILGGLSLVAASLWEMSGFTPDVTMATLVRTGVIQGLGLGLVFVPLSTTAFSTLTPQFRAEGTAMFSLMRNIGSSIGISVMTFLLARTTQTVHAGLAATITPFRPELAAPWLPEAWSLHTPAGVIALNAEVTEQALTIAYLGDFTIMMWMTIAAAPLLLLLRPPRRMS